MVNDDTSPPPTVNWLDGLNVSLLQVIVLVVIGEVPPLEVITLLPVPESDTATKVLLPKATDLQALVIGAF